MRGVLFGDGNQIFAEPVLNVFANQIENVKFNPKLKIRWFASTSVGSPPHTTQNLRIHEIRWIFWTYNIQCPKITSSHTKEQLTTNTAPSELLKTMVYTPDQSMTLQEGLLKSKFEVKRHPRKQG